MPKGIEARDYIDEDEGRDDNVPCCCDDNPEHMGRLGRLLWYRCRYCGMEYAVRVADEEDEK